MNDSLRIVVCDDDARRSRSWRDAISASLGHERAEVLALSTGEFARAVKQLHQRVQASKANSSRAVWVDESPFDGADFVVIDSDLTPDPRSQIEPDAAQDVSDHLVGEFGSNVAWLARNFSTAGTLIVVNHIHKARVFDLTMTRFAHLPADVYVSADDVANSALWTGEIDGGFRPWSWPNLMGLSSRSYSENYSLDTLVADVLGLDHEELDLFDQRQLDRLLSDSQESSRLTLGDIAMSTTYGYGHQPGALFSPAHELSLAMSGLRRWVDATVVPAQNVFIDLPHLLQDRPWLAGEARQDKTEFNRVMDTAWSDSPVPGLLEEAFSAEASLLTGRALWRVSRLGPDPERRRVRPDDFVFCEDTSTFETPVDVREYVSDIEGAFRSRFVRKVGGVSYSPSRRLAV